MPTNPFLKKLGFDEADRVVVLHADDIGMCQASVQAYADLLDSGIMSSAAAMVPCPWFPAAAECFRQRREHPRLDVGVHLTLNSEWQLFRWGPISTRDAASGLMDREGFFDSRVSEARARAVPAAVERELIAQIERALAAGLEPTHIDTHMFALLQPDWLPIYIRLAETYRVPAFLLRPGETWPSVNPDQARRIIGEAEERGLPVFDSYDMFSLTEASNRLDDARRMLERLPAGLTNILCHPACDTPELRALAPDWRCRVADYELFRDEAFRALLEAAGVRVIGFGALREAMRRPA
jgi:predicted glycoside hydrolase/deacetylase ChbG (UPF0249 family)